MKEKILVTGAKGRLGGKVVQKLLSKGYSVRVVDRDTEGLWEKFGKFLKRKRIEIVQLDLLNPDERKISAICEGIDFVIHLAALIDYSASEKDLININAIATGRLAHLAKKAGAKGIVFASSTSVTRKPRYLPIDENHPYSPQNAYGRSKLMAEHFVKHSGLDYAILRMSIIYGAGFEEGFSQVVKAVKRGKMKIIGKGVNRISFVHVDDAVNAFLLALNGLEKQKFRNEIFIITGKPFTQLECYTEIARQLKVKPPEEHVSKFLAYLMAFVEEKKAALYGRKQRMAREYVHTLAEDRYFDTSKAEEMLGWKQKVSFPEGLKRFIKSIRGRWNG